MTAPVAVVPVQATGAVIDLFLYWVHGKLVVHSTDQMPEGMATEGVASQEDNVEAHNEGTDADAEGLAAIGPGPDEGEDGVVG